MKDDASRRDFLKNSVVTAAVAGGAGACVCGLSGCASSSAPKADKASLTAAEGKVLVDLAKVPALAEVGGAVQLAGDGVPGPIIVIRAKTDEYAALSMKCTHFGRPLDYDHASGKLRCVSFGHSEFDLEGKVLKGPAKKPLTVYASALKESVLEITV
jgi:Rieske Fe-S protein